VAKSTVGADVEYIQYLEGRGVLQMLATRWPSSCSRADRPSQRVNGRQLDRADRDRRWQKFDVL